MKTTLKRLFAGIIITTAALQASADDEYVGVHFTIPLNKEGMGMQLVLRRDNLEVRGGMDSNQRAQLGGGLTVGDTTTASAGFALSSYHKGLVPYLGASYEAYNDWEVGAVSYNTDLNYAYVGKRIGDDDDDGNRSAPAGGGDNSGDGDSGGDNNSGDNGGNNGGGSSGGGNDSANSGNHSGNHSGHEDGTNPGRGKGRDNSPNTGTDNPGGS